MTQCYTYTKNISRTLKIIAIILHISFVFGIDSYPISLSSDVDVFNTDSNDNNINLTVQTDITLTRNVFSKLNKNEIEIPHIFVVNLDRAVSRWNHIQEVMTEAELEVERLPGVDGRQLTREELNVMSTKISIFFQPKGVIGCYLSHRKFWQYVVDRNYSSAIIFEDDVRLIPGFKKKLTSSLQRLEQDKLEYDIIFLGWFLFHHYYCYSLCRRGRERF
jgi:hypothetical protein